MHDNTLVAVISCGKTASIKSLINKNHLPFMVFKNENNFDAWWKVRMVPESRYNLDYLLKTLKLTNYFELLEINHGLSLIDHYWICKEDENVKWEDINYFANDFHSNEEMILLSDKIPNLTHISAKSPDFCTTGCLPKTWIIGKGKRFLLKSGSGEYKQEIYNEVIASIIMEELGIDHIKYELFETKLGILCKCENFLSKDMELIHMNDITFDKKPNLPLYDYCIQVCENLGVKNIKRKLEEMIFVDFIIADEDRHLNNFGLIRNSKSLEFVGFAPIYDSGGSLFYHTKTEFIEYYKDECQPFKLRQSRQIELVKDFSWLNIDRIYNCLDKVGEILKHLDKNRAKTILEQLKNRIKMLESIIKNSHNETKDREDRRIHEDGETFDPFSGLK